MKIETDDYIPLSDVPMLTGLSQSTAYRIAKRLGLVVEVFGVKVIRKDKLEAISEDRKPTGNPVWINDSEAASESALRSIESRMERIAQSGETASEKRRNRRLAKIGAAYGKSAKGKPRPTPAQSSSSDTTGKEA